MIVWNVQEDEESVLILDRDGERFAAIKIFFTRFPTLQERGLRSIVC